MIAQLNTILRRIRLLCRLAVLVRSNSDADVQILQVKAGADETLTDVEHREPYGYTSRPHQGAEAVVISLGGNTSHSMVLMVGDRRYRLKGLKEGEVALHDDQGNVVHLQREQILVNAVQKLQITAPETAINSNLTVTGNTVFNGQVSANGKRIDETHKHTGVQSGGSTSGAVS